MKTTLVRRIFFLYLGILLLCFTVLLWHVDSIVTSNYYSQMEEKLREEADLTAKFLSPEDLKDLGKLRDLVRRISEGYPERITVVLPDGTVAADSTKDFSLLANHSDREEIKRALRGETFFAKRQSDSLSEEFLYFARPLRDGPRVAAALRIAAKLETSLTGLEDLKAGILIAGVFAVLLASLGSYFIVRTFNSPILSIQQAAQRFAQGDFDVRLVIDRPKEIRSLAQTMNWMAEQLKNRIETISSQRRELEAILEGMIEAVIVLGEDLRVKEMNRAAENLFGKGRDSCLGKTILEAYRTSELDALARELLAGQGLAERVVTLYVSGKLLHLQAQGTLLAAQPAEGGRLLLVLHDVTRLKQLEEVRRDFVANVSHELKTPITSIQGFVETLKDGALEDRETALHFLGIVEKQAKRLNSIIEDLLALSRLEQTNKKIAKEKASLASLLDRVFEVCLPAAAAKNISLERDCPRDLQARVNEVLLEQAVTNLVDNAVKYSEEGGKVQVSAAAEAASILLKVSDDGPGIPAKDLPRIFERFYRVDKARSRALGGTGLGLAIVKHIVLAHEGQVWAESELEKGSTFFIRLPVEAAVDDPA